MLNKYDSSTVWLVDSEGSATGLSTMSYGVRPTIILKAAVKVSSGTGSKSNRVRIDGDIGAPYTDALLNTRKSGEYVSFDSELYRIVSIEDGITKLNKVDYLRDGSKNVLIKRLATTSNYGSSSNTKSDNYWDYYLNNTWYATISNTYKNMLVKGTYYLGKTENSVSYKNSICSTVDVSISTLACSKTTSTWRGYVGIPRYGEMFATQIGEGESSSNNYWLITPSTSYNSWYLDKSAYASRYSTTSAYLGVRPSITLSSTVKITGGSGTENSPYQISL